MDMCGKEMCVHTYVLHGVMDQSSDGSRWRCVLHGTSVMDQGGGVYCMVPV